MTRNVPGTPVPDDYGAVSSNSLQPGLPSRQVLGQRSQSSPPGSGDAFGISRIGDRPTAARKSGEALLSDADRSRPASRAAGLPGQASPDHGSD